MTITDVRSPSVLQSFLINLSSSNPAETPGSEAGETWREIASNFADEVFLSYSTGFF
jgi:hypothetical protein